MSYAIIGFGKIGRALAKAFARSGVEVSVATTRERLRDIRVRLEEDGQEDDVRLDGLVQRDGSDPRSDSGRIGCKALRVPVWRRKTIVDVTNAYGVPPEQLEGQPSSKFIAKAFTGGLVKGFNHLGAGVLEQDPAVHGGRRVVFLASDDEDAAAEIGELAEKLGFAHRQLYRNRPVSEDRRQGLVCTVGRTL